MHIVTTTTGNFTLTVRYAGSMNHSPGNITPVVQPFNLSGATSYDRTYTLEAVSYGCAALWVGVGVSTTPGAQAGGPTYADLNAPPC